MLSTQHRRRRRHQKEMTKALNSLSANDRLYGMVVYFSTARGAASSRVFLLALLEAADSGVDLRASSVMASCSLSTGRFGDGVCTSMTISPLTMLLYVGVGDTAGELSIVGTAVVGRTAALARYQGFTFGGEAGLSFTLSFGLVCNVCMLRTFSSGPGT